MSSILQPTTMEPGVQVRRKWLGPAVLIVAGLIVLFVYLAPSTFIAVHPGQAGVLWRRFWGGSELAQVYREGTVVIWPWDKLYLYDTTLQHVRTQTTVLSTDGLALTVTVSGRFRIDPERLPRLHAEVGPDYVSKLVEPDLLASVRAVFGRYRAEDAYASSEDGLLAALHSDFASRLAPFGLSSGDVQLERVAMPDNVQEAIQRKLASGEAVQRERLEKERRIIEAEGLAAFQSISGVSPLHWGAIEATSELAKSPNSKIIVIGNDQKSLPVILNAEFDDAAGSAGSAGSAARTPVTPSHGPTKLSDSK